MSNHVENYIELFGGIFRSGMKEDREMIKRAIKAELINIGYSEQKAKEAFQEHSEYIGDRVDEYMQKEYKKWPFTNRGTVYKNRTKVKREVLKLILW